MKLLASVVVRRVGFGFVLLALLAAAAYWLTRPKPVAVVLKKVERGNVIASVVNTRATYDSPRLL